MAAFGLITIHVGEDVKKAIREGFFKGGIIVTRPVGTLPPRMLWQQQQHPIQQTAQILSRDYSIGAVGKGSIAQARTPGRRKAEAFKLFIWSNESAAKLLEIPFKPAPFTQIWRISLPDYNGPGNV